MQECAICVEPYDRYTHRCITCPFCDKSCCFECIRTSLIVNLKPLVCLHCSKSWNIQNMSEAGLDPVWIQNEYKHYRELFLLEQSRAFLPEAQEYVYKKKVREELLKRYEEELNQSALGRLNGTSTYAHSKRIMIKIRDLTSKDWLEHVDLYLGGQESAPISTEIQTRGESSQTASDKQPVRRLKFRCPDENCPGYIKNDLCMLCRIEVCPTCWIKKTDNHACKQDDIFSVKEILENAKQCPNCSAWIIRSEGCAHMFCIYCKHGFDWNTMETISIHQNTNPYIRNETEELRIIRSQVEQSELDKDNPYYQFFNTTIYNYSILFDKINNTFNVDTIDHLSLAVRYVEGKLTMDEWAQKVQQADKLIQRNRAFTRCLREYISQCIRLLNNVNAVNMKSRYQKMLKLKETTYKELDKLKSLFKSKVELTL